MNGVPNGGPTEHFRSVFSRTFLFAGGGRGYYGAGLPMAAYKTRPRVPLA